jgi:dienelactone hydrolase
MKIVHRTVLTVVSVLAVAVAVGYGTVQADERSGADATSPRDASRGVVELLAKPLLDPATPRRELVAFVKARIPRMPSFESVADWQTYAARLRRKFLQEVIFRGEARAWRQADVCVEWFEEIPGGPGYRIRKFRYEALPGFWIPALLYEPEGLRRKAPVFVNVNGHDELGKSTTPKQMRCINLAKRGVLSYSLEFIYGDQLRIDGNQHNRLPQLDLCGTSGMAPFYLCLTRGLDVALSHEYADSTRVGVAGLSGGGWQTLLLAALDERVALANPVAGYSSMLSRLEHLQEVGDSEQIPCDMCTLADYTHLTALVAPRPLLLTYNARDECCFVAEHALPPLVKAARPIYELSEHADFLRTHVNNDPGTHNFDKDNREALYRLVGDHFFPGAGDFVRRDIPPEKGELKTPSELSVPMPKRTETLNSLAEKLSRSLPRGTEVQPGDPDSAARRFESRRRLHDIVRYVDFDTKRVEVENTIVGDCTSICWRLSFNDRWTAPAIEFDTPNAGSTTVICSDKGRQDLGPDVERLVATGERVVAIDLLGFGEGKGTIDGYEISMIETVGHRLLGIQAGQLAAVARWMKGRYPTSPVKLVAFGPRTSAISRVAAALETEAVSEVETNGAWRSLKTLIDRDMDVRDAPELFCFGLLQEFDLPQIEALAQRAEK